MGTRNGFRSANGNNSDPDNNRKGGDPKVYCSRPLTIKGCTCRINRLLGQNKLRFFRKVSHGMKSGSSRKHTSGNVGSTLTIKNAWLGRSVWSSACGDMQTWMKVPKRHWTNSNSYTFVTLTLGRGNMYISDRAASDHALSASSRQKEVLWANIHFTMNQQVK